jgi:hypothetical protein
MNLCQIRQYFVTESISVQRSKIITILSRFHPSFRSQSFWHLLDTKHCILLAPHTIAQLEGTVPQWGSKLKKSHPPPPPQKKILKIRAQVSKSSRAQVPITRQKSLERSTVATIRSGKVGYRHQLASLRSA